MIALIAPFCFSICTNFLLLLLPTYSFSVKTNTLILHHLWYQINFALFKTGLGTRCNEENRRESRERYASDSGDRRWKAPSLTIRKNVRLLPNFVTERSSRSTSASPHSHTLLSLPSSASTTRLTT